MALPSPLEIERAGLRCWPATEVEWDRSWVRRAASGHTHRANSVQCFDPADDGDVEARIDGARRWHEARGIEPCFRINLLSGPNLVAALDRLGWGESDHSALMAMPLGAVEADPAGELLPIDGAAFLAAQSALKHWDAATERKFNAIAASFEVPATGIVLRGDDGRIVSSALMAIADGIVVTGNVVTDSAERQKGYALRMMRTGLAWAHQAGAHTAALNVAADNPAGIGLYERLGYRRQYDYVYRTPGKS